MADSVEFRVISDQIPTLLAALPDLINGVLDTTANNVVSGCKTRSRVDTGAMRDGWTQETTGPQERTVYNPVPYSIFNEMGTRFMSAAPMLTPSMEEQAQPFIDALGAAIQGAVK